MGKPLPAAAPTALSLSTESAPEGMEAMSPSVGCLKAAAGRIGVEGLDIMKPPNCLVTSPEAAAMTMRMTTMTRTTMTATAATTVATRWQQ